MSNKTKNTLFITRIFGPQAHGRREKILDILYRLKKLGHNIDIVTIDEEPDIQNSFKSEIYNIVDECYSLKDPLRIFSRFLLQKKTDKSSIKRMRPSNHSCIANFFLSFPDPSLFWYLFNRKKILTFSKKRKYTHIFTWSMPNSAHLLGLYLKKRLPYLTWLLCYRDPWSNNATLHPSLLVRRFNLYFEHNALNASTKAITFPGITPGGIDFFIKSFGLKISNKVLLAPNMGFNENLINIPLPKIYSPYSHDVKTLHFVHIGRFYGGDHSAATFLQALDKVLEQYPLSIRVDFFGDIIDSDLTIIHNSKRLTSSVKIHSYLPQNEVFNMATGADAALWFQAQKALPSDNIPSKIPEYISLDLPIVAFVSETNKNDIVKNLQLGYSVSVKNVEEIVNMLKKLIFGKKYNCLIKPQNKHLFSRHTFLDWFESQWIKL
ncbi:MAG: hypothetical protein K9L30_13585 [Desulfobacterales bacterium]|nr:hypothetical protein [Desulfobacterales bacterium]